MYSATVMLPRGGVANRPALGVLLLLLPPDAGPPSRAVCRVVSRENRVTTGPEASKRGGRTLGGHVVDALLTLALVAVTASAVLVLLVVERVVVALLALLHGEAEP
jgi:hypothetical protein